MFSRGWSPDRVSDGSARIRGSSRGAWLGVLALVLTIGASPASAQHDAAALARIDSLAEAWRAAKARVEAADSATRALLRLDTLDYFGFLVVTDSADVPELRRAASRALQQVASDLGPIDAKLLEGGVAFVRFVGGQSWIHLVSRGAEFIEVPREQRERRLEGQVAFAASQWLLTRGGTILRGATGGRLGTTVDWLLERAFIELITTPSLAARLCYAGDARSCGRAMGVVPTDNPLTEWYDPQDRITIARRFEGSVRRSLQDVYGRCVSGEFDESCIEFLPRVLGDPPRAPFSPRVTASLVGTAIGMGSDGGYTRLVADTTVPLVPRLEAAAGTDIDSVLTTWRAAVLATRPTPEQPVDRTTWSTLVWVIVAGVLAMRSSRWR